MVTAEANYLFLKALPRARIEAQKGNLLLEQFVRNMRKEAIGFGVYVSYPDEHLPDHAIKQKLEAWTKAWEYFENEVPKARSARENELHGILGAK